MRLIFKRIGHIIRIGHEGGSVRFAVEPDFGDAFVAVLIGIEEIDVDLMALDIALDNPDALSPRAEGIAPVIAKRLRSHPNPPGADRNTSNCAHSPNERAPWR